MDPAPALPTPDPAPARARTKLGVMGWLDLIFDALGYGCAAGNAVALLRVGDKAALVAAVAAGVAVGAWLGRLGREYVRAGREVFVFGVLMGWGLALNHDAVGVCQVSRCDLDGVVLRPLAEPQVYGLLGLYLLTALAYAVSRRRPEALRPRAEALVHGALLAGAVVQFVVLIQFADMLVYAVLLPATFPVIAPLLAMGHFLSELAARLRRRGEEPRAVAAVAGAAAIYREPSPLVVRGKGIDRALLARALGVGPLLLGLHAVVQAAWFGRASAALEVFTATCSHPLSQVPLVLVEKHCHYLCTVAAQGHPWLVRPERLGRRRGQVIVVNRQLAVANAFEDLLHERWPRFGAWARRTYDRLGLPVSRLIRWRWLADLVYLAMKPAEWCFLLTLLLLDRRSPEERIDRMYRL